MTALFYRALADAIRISTLNHDSAHVEAYEKMRRGILESYHKELWNADRGLYRDGKPFVTSVQPNKWLPADVAMESFSVQNNTFAILYGLAPKAQRASIAENIIHHKNWDVTPYFMHFVFEGVAEAGLFGKYGVEKMHEYKIYPETQTVREMGPNRGDYSHGWIASPTYQMSARILGVRPLAPAFEKMEISPEWCGLKWAKGSVPTPHGPVEVSWNVEGDKIKFEIQVPTGVQAVLKLPVRRPFELNGKKSGTVQSGYYEAVLPEGKSTGTASLEGNG